MNRMRNTCSVALLLIGLTSISFYANATPMLYAGTGNYYDIIASPGIGWDSAKTAAEGMSFNGMTGHLATATSVGEDQFLDDLRKTLLTNEAWLGGFQPPGSAEPFEGWQWINGEGLIAAGTNGIVSYENWLGGEPNDVGGGEGHIALGLGNQFGWNDEGSLGLIGGYLVEYESVPEPTTLALMGLGLAGIGYRRRQLQKA